MISFGGGSNEGGEPVGQNIRQQLVELEKELGVWKVGLRHAYDADNYMPTN